MGKDFFETSETARRMAVQAGQVLGFDLAETMFNGPDEELTKTSRCQPALYLHGLMALALLREKIPAFAPAAAAGLSLGEFTAHAAAGTFSFEDGLAIVGKRGAFMEQACGETQGSMAALIGGEEDKVRELATATGVDVANFNAPGQIVLSGDIAGIDQAIARAKDFGIRRAIKLNVAGAYHSRLMKSAQDKLAAELAFLTISPPGIPVIANFTAESAATPEAIRTSLRNQVTGSVRWTESIQRLDAMGATTFIELGPGKVIAGLVSKTRKDATVFSIEDLDSLESTTSALLG